MCCSEVNEDGTLTYIDFEDTSYDPVDMLVYNEKEMNGSLWLVKKVELLNLIVLVRKKADKFMKLNIAVW